MRSFLTFAAALAAFALAFTPLAARSPTGEQIEVMNAAQSFFDALRSEDKTALARLMLPEGTMMIDDRMNPEKSNLIILPNAAYLQSHQMRDEPIKEIMHFEMVHVSGGIAQVWGPYYFTVADKLTHCGINSLSFLKTQGEWKVGNSSFTMVPPQACDATVAKVNNYMEFEQ